MINSPHLTPAFELDEAIMKFSMEISSRYNLSPRITTESDMHLVMETFKNHVMPGLKLWEFYVLPVQILAAELAQHLTKVTPDFSKWSKHPFYLEKVWTLPLAEQAARLHRDGSLNSALSHRLGKRLSVETAAIFVCASLQISNGASINLSTISQQYQKLLDEINVSFYREYDVDMKIINDNLCNRIKYERLAEHGPKLGKVSLE